MKVFGVTETFDPAFVRNWNENLKEANIIISKRLTDEMIRLLVENNDKIIFHHTVTGLGGTEYEPRVRTYLEEFERAQELFNAGFPISHYVLRIDPIIPSTRDNINAVNNVLKTWSQFCINGAKLRCRLSIIDQYKHLSERGLKLPWSGFNAPKSAFTLVAMILNPFSNSYEFESCAENGFSEYDFIDTTCGCASYKDLKILGIDESEYGYPEQNQRAQCRCLDKKQILGVKPYRCNHQCIYCYWKEG